MRRLINFTISLILVLQVGLPSIAFAEDVAVPVMSPVKVGDRAPFSGVLLNPAAVAQVKVNLDEAKSQCDITTKKAVDTQLALSAFTLANEKAAHEKDVAVSAAIINEKTLLSADLQNRLDAAKKNESNPYLWIGVGVISGTVLTVLTVFALSNVK